MRIRNAASVGVAAIGAVMLTSAPATAADTVTTFTVTATTGLAVSAPGTSTLSSAAPGGTASGALGAVSVNDQRSQLGTTWEVTVSLSQTFKTGGGTTSETIPNANVSYAPGTSINPVNPPFTPGTAGDLSASRTAFSRTSGDGANSVSWNPQLTVTVPAGNISGPYSGTVTHSVA
jgi:hypothetical protein